MQGAYKKNLFVLVFEKLSFVENILHFVQIKHGLIIITFQTQNSFSWTHGKFLVYDCHISLAFIYISTILMISSTSAIAPIPVSPQASLLEIGSII